MALSELLMLRSRQAWLCQCVNQTRCHVNRTRTARWATAWAVMVRIARWTMYAFFTPMQLDIWRDKRSCANTLLAQTVANGITRSI
jgi:hypothetical protein